MVQDIIDPKGSKLGGHPYVPADFVWPRCDIIAPDDEFPNSPLEFLAQINLEELHQLEPNLPYPKRGMLYFFVDRSSDWWTAGKARFNGWRCYYLPVIEGDFTKQVPPSSDEKVRVYRERKVEFANTYYSFPFLRDFLSTLGTMSQDQMFMYARIAGKKVLSRFNDKVIFDGVPLDGMFSNDEKEQLSNEEKRCKVNTLFNELADLGLISKFTDEEFCSEDGVVKIPHDSSRMLEARYVRLKNSLMGVGNDNPRYKYYMGGYPTLVRSYYVGDILRRIEEQYRYVQRCTSYMPEGNEYRVAMSESKLKLGEESDWISLIEFGSDLEPGAMSWGGGGVLGFFIRKHNLEAGCFDQVWAMVRD